MGVDERGVEDLRGVSEVDGDFAQAVRVEGDRVRRKFNPGDLCEVLSNGRAKSPKP